jgi:hypothetical protein
MEASAELDWMPNQYPNDNKKAKKEISSINFCS